MSKNRQPWLKFYPANWFGDVGLRRCSIAARGMWIDMLMIMQQAEPYGELRMAGVALDEKDLAEVARISPRQASELVAELEKKGVFSRTDDGIIYSRKMKRDFIKYEQDRENGRGGGNPAITKSDCGVVNGGDNPQVNPDGGQEVNGGDNTKKKEERGKKKEKKEGSLRSLDQIALDFEVWWVEYPRKVGKQKARERYTEAWEKVGAEKLLATVRAQRWPEEPSFIPHPATWLGEGRWDDDPHASTPPKHLALGGKPSASAATLAILRAGGVDINTLSDDDRRLLWPN